ncbi:MAG: protein phosphatase 2C domain-containing protein [Halioglobus sp.]|nr:protein phosphatase 2C domain-containing protein [Halioglobus sp.]
MDPQHFEIGAHSSAGPRHHNEDCYLVDRELGLVIVADGVGGHAGGEVASQITCETLQREVAAGQTLEEAILSANREVFSAVSAGRGKRGMASTVVALLLRGQDYELAWVGDSRAYLWHTQLSLVTRDHSYVEAQLARGIITREEARSHPRRHVILQAVGLNDDDELEIGSNRGQLHPGGALLLCSDGVSDTMDARRLALVLGRPAAAPESCERLVEQSIEHGGKDNSTAVLIRRNDRDNGGAGTSSAESAVWVYDPDTDDRDAALAGPAGDTQATDEVTGISAGPEVEGIPAPSTANRGPPHSPAGTPRHSRLPLAATVLVLAGLALVAALLLA